MRDIIRKKRNWIALAAASSLALTAFTANAQDQEDDADQEVEKHESDEGDKKRRVKIIENGKVVKEFKGSGKWEFIGPEIERTIHIERRRAVEDALEEVREALQDVSERLEKAEGRQNKRALEAAKESLESAIEALETQRENELHTRATIDIHPDVERRMIVLEREAVRDALERLDEEAEELMESREEVLEGIEEMREEIAEEIEELTIEIEEGDDRHVIRLRALRDAELAVSQMEEHHLSAIRSAEKELKRARERLEKKLVIERKKREAKKEKKDDN